MAKQNNDGKIEISDSLELMDLDTTRKAYPIEALDWQDIKDDLNKVTDKDGLDIMNSIGSCLLGASISVFVSLFTSTIPSDKEVTCYIVAFALLVISFITFVGCYILKGYKKSNVENVLNNMGRIERKFKNNGN